MKKKIAILLCAVALIGTSIYSFKINKDVSATAIQIRAEHPRIHLSPDNIAEYRLRWEAHPRKSQCLAKAEDGSDPVAAAFAYQMTGNATYARTAIAKALDGTLQRARSLSLVFDWCYDQLTSEEKATLLAIIKSKVSVATPSDSQSQQWVFHSEEWASNAGGYDPDGGLYDNSWYGWLAIAGDDPDAAAKFTKLWNNGTMTKPVAIMDYLNDGAWNEGSYWLYQAKHLLMIDRFLLLKSATSNEYASKYLKNIGNFILYQSDIYNSKAIWNVIGDGAQFSGNEWQIRRNMLYATAWAQNPYYQWYLKNVSGHQPKNTDTWVNYDSWGVDRYTGIEDMLFYNPLLEARSLAELPRSHFFSGVGLMLMGSGWDSDATHISFKASDFLDGHNHFDAGSFQIFKKGYALAPDTGTYSFFGNDHYRNWFMRTIAHNTLQIENPAESVSYYAHISDNNVKADGSQPYPGVRARNLTEFNNNIAYTNLSDIPAWENTPSYDYVSSNITAAYNQPYNNIYTADTVKRELAFLKDGYLVVYDRVETKQPEYKKRWLLHFEGEPIFSSAPVAQEVPGHIETYSSINQSIASTHPKNSQKLYVKTVLPENSNIEKIGGRQSNILSNTLKQGTFTEPIGHLNDDSVVPMELEYWNGTATTPRYERGIFIVNQSTNCNVSITVNATTLDFVCAAAANSDHNVSTSINLTIFDTLEKIVVELNRQFIANDANQYNDWKAIVSAGYEFWNNGKNYPIEPGTDSTRYNKWVNGDISTGKWRIEVSPTVASKKNTFLNVLYMPNSDVAMPAISNIDAGLMTGVFIADPNENNIILFNSDYTSAPITNEITFSVTTTTAAKYLFFGLAPNSLYTYDIDGVVATKKTGVAGGLSFVGAGAGVHAIKINLSGVAGVYPAQPTEIELNGITASKTGTVTWTKSADDGAGDNDVVNYNIYRSATKEGIYSIIGTTANGVATFIDSNPFGGWNYYKVSAVDSGGLESSLEAMDAPGLVFDSPSITSVSVKDRTSTSTIYTNERIVDITVAATDPQGNDTIAKYLINESATKPSATTMNNSGSSTIPSAYTLISNEGSIAVYVWVMDADGNISDATAGSSATINLDLTVPTAPGSLDLVIGDDSGKSSADNLTKNTTALTITGTGENGAVVQLYDGVSTIGSTSTIANGAFSIDLTLAEGSHSITAKQTDPVGNISLASAALDIIIDTTGPPILNIISSPNTNTTDLVFNSNDSIVFEIDYGITTAYGSSTIRTNTYSTLGQSTLTNLTENTTYHYRIKGIDEAGNITYSEDGIFKTSQAAIISIPTPALVSEIVATAQSVSSSSNNHNSSNKKKDSTPALSLSVSKKIVANGETIIEKGKKFSKDSFVLAYFSKPGGGYYPPVKVKTRANGSFELVYKVNKPKGKYSWYVVDVKTKKKSKINYFKVK